MAFNLKSIFSLARPPAGSVPSPRGLIPGAFSPSINEDTAMTVSAFHRGVIYISTQIAKLPWDVKDKDNKIQVGRIPNLLGLAPNPEMNALTWRLLMVQNAIIHGNAYAEIQRDGAGRIVALWPLASKEVDAVRSTTGKLYYRVRQGTANATGDDVYLDPYDVFHLKNFHTKDGVMGQGLVAYASQTLGISSAADRMASGIFSNGGMPSGVLMIEGKLSDEAYTRLVASWKEAHSGRRAGSTAILEQGSKYESISTDPEVLQFLDSRKFGVVEIARFLGLPPSKLMDMSAGTYANVEQANLEVATDTLDAWACNLEMEADVKILTNRFGGLYSEIDLYSVFRGDMTTRANYFQKMMQNAAITPNEIRAREGMAPYDGGEKFFVAANNFTPANRLDEVIDAQIASKNTSTATIDSAASQKDVTPSQTEAQRQLTAAAISFLKK